MLEFARPYIPELVGWFRDFGVGAANYDANGHYARIQPIFNAFQLAEVPGNPATLVPLPGLAAARGPADRHAAPLPGLGQPAAARRLGAVSGLGRQPRLRPDPAAGGAMRFLAPIVLLVVVAVVVVFVLTREDEDRYQVRAIFDNAGFIIPGEDVKIAGVKVGKVADLEVTDDFKAAVVLEITEPGYQDFRSDASCIVRPQNLIGERFVECKPTQPRTASSDAAAAAARDRGRPGRGPVPAAGLQHDADGRHRPDRQHDARARARAAVADPQRARHRRGGPRQGPQRGHPARQPGAAGDRQGAAILARQNDQLEQLAVNSDTVLAPLARDRERVASSIRNSSEVALATAEKRDALADDIETLPRFLDELEPTMVRLGALADESTPVLTDLGENATDINSLIRRLGPFSQAAIPAVDSLGEASKTGTPAVIDARPVIADLRGLAKSVRPVGVTLREVLESFRDTGGIERAMDYIFYQVAAVNGFDSVGHYLRAGLLVNACTTYAVAPVAGCSAKFPVSTASASSSGSGETSAINAAGDDPVLRATAIALAKALGQEIEKARKQQAAAKQAKDKAATKQPTQSKRTRARRQGQARGGDPRGDPDDRSDRARGADARADRRARGADRGPARGRGAARAPRPRRRPRTRPTRCWTTSSGVTDERRAAAASPPTPC